MVILLFFVFLISLIPVFVFWIQIYRPMNRIVRSAEKFMDGRSHPPIPYDKDDELGMDDVKQATDIARGVER